MEREDSFAWDDSLYVPFNTVPLSGGPFLSYGWNAIEQYLKLPDRVSHGIRDRFVGGSRLPRRRLAAARVHGDSMIERDILDGDIATFQRSDFEDLHNNTVMVIEKIGEVEGAGAWALEKACSQAPPITESG